MELYYKLVARMATTFASVREDEEGQTLVEYALIIALVALVLLGAIAALSGGIDHIFTGAGAKLSNVST